MRGFITTTILVASMCLGVIGNTNSLPIWPILLDDMDYTLKSEMMNVFEGTHEACMVDAYNRQYHHDNSRNKGSASFTFKFVPPADGCYVLEEHHPGKSTQCSQYLPRNARLDIKYCKGQSSTIYINQAVKGGQWNEVVSLPFYKGYEGNFTMRNAPNERCELQGNCLWVVDAFRLTWKGTRCSSSSKSTLQEGAEGVLLLNLNMADGDDTANLQMKIQDQKAVLETTLATHFGYESVSIAEVSFVASGRRLREQPLTLKIRFIAHEKMTVSKGADLKKALQADFDAISPGVAVDSASVEWSLAVPVRTHDEPQSSTMTLVLYIGAGCATFVTLGIFSLFVWKLCVRTSDVQTGGAQPEDLKQAKRVEDSKHPKELDAAENSSVSTGTPASDDDVHSAGNSIPSSDQKDEKNKTPQV